MKPIKQGEITIVQTDKTSRVIVTTPEEYLKMLEVHTKNDTEISIEEATKKAKSHDAHMSSWLKMLNIGETWSQQKRIRQSFLGCESLASMDLLIKDHKKVNPGEPFPSRAVVNGRASYNIALSETISILMESVYKDIKDEKGVWCSDEIQRNIQILNDMINETGLQVYTKECDSEIRKEMKENPEKHSPICLIATDNKALYPSLERRETTKIIRNMIEKTEINIENIDLDEILVYLKINENELRVQGSLNEIAPFLP